MNNKFKKFVLQLLQKGSNSAYFVAIRSGLRSFSVKYPKFSLFILLALTYWIAPEFLEWLDVFMENHGDLVIILLPLLL